MSRVQLATTPRGPVVHGRSPARPAGARPGPARGGDVEARRRYADDDRDDVPQGRDGADAGGWDDGRPRPGGLPYRLAIAAMANPVLTGGTILSLVAAVAIVTNALSNQTRRHPAPLFETRPFAAAPAIPARTAGHAGAGQLPVPVPAPTPAAAPAPAAAQIPAPSHGTGMVDTMATAAVPRAKPRLDGTQLIRDVQVALRERNFYNGPIDGIPGPATADAIRVFERLAGLPVTGEANERVLNAAMMGAQGQGGPAGAVSVANNQGQRTAPIPVRTTAVTPPAPLGRSSGPEPLASGGDEKLQRVQRALNAAGYGPLRGDGRMDERTQDAIRRYELERGWPVTGRASDRLALDVMMQPTR